MTDYALLVAPSASRVYAGEAPRLIGAELAGFGDTVLGAHPRDTAYPSNLSVPVWEELP